MGGGAESDSDVTEGPRHALPRGRVDWALCFYVSSGAPASIRALFSEVVSPRVGCWSTPHFSCLILPSSWPDTMGVTCVSQMPVAEGKSVQQTVELLTRKLEMLGAEKQGTFCVDCETYHTAASTLGSQGQAGKLMYVMHNSEYPLSCFALFENGPCLVADTNFDVLMVKLKGFFQSAKASKIETRGTRYQYCDFLVKVGTVTMGPSARGISVEVEYGPCVVASDCWSLLLEFLQSFLGSHTPGAPAVFGNRHDAVYSPADTMVQYMELFNKIRKQQQILWMGRDLERTSSLSCNFSQYPT
uniref:Mediator of RNA polymerase II transcription subunit 20 n=2 Tax=Bovinae TaxID=27592 RepID=F6RGV5_BOVIN